MTANVSETIARQILAMLYGEDLMPGEKLNVDRLAQKFSVSKTPVREALKKLENDGLIEAIPRAGWRIAVISPEKDEELFEFQKMLDVYVLQRLMFEPGAIDIDAGRRLNREIEKVVEILDYRAIMELNIKFHLQLCENCKNGTLLDTMRRLWSKAFLHRTFIATTQDYLDNIVVEHERLLDALATRDLELFMEVQNRHWHRRQLKPFHALPDKEHRQDHPLVG